MIVEVDSPAFEELIDPTAELVHLGRCCQFTEAPCDWLVADALEKTS